MHRQWRHSSCLLLALLLLNDARAQVTADPPFIAPGSTVLLFPGLPGDVESERTYNEQLTSLLHLAQECSAAKVLLFSDAEVSALTSAKNVHRFKASRTAFLEAAAQLPASTNPVTAFVWGHGGMQGPTPVFHVRGPRLTPVDFKLFADKVTSGSSTWILMFRGSGQFAAAMAGAERHVIASEGESVFRNDPIGMTVLLKMLRTNPRTTLRAITEAFGPAVARWFDDQNLARTEEPTLWAQTEVPRRLIASVEPMEKPPVSDEPVRRPTTPNQNTNALAWTGIEPVKAQEFAGADAVILKRHITYTLAANPAVVAEHDEYIQVLTPEGKEAGDFDITYSPPHETVEFVACEVQRRDGSVLKIDPDEIRETDDSSEESPGAALTRRKFFSLPDVHPRAILHVRYVRQWQKFPLPHVTLNLPLADDAPVRETTIRVTVPKGSAFHFRFDHIAAPDPRVNQTDYSSSHTWVLRNIPAWEPAPLSPPDSQPSLDISTFPDWKGFADWYERIIRLADQPSAEITNKAAEITRDLAAPREKIAALYNYVTGLRYVAVPLGVNSFRPHAASGVLRNQYGDCKDKANLFNALLRSQGVEAHLVLVPRFSQAHDTLPGFAFNHAISRASLGEETLWLDTTDDICRFGMLPPGDPARRVLVIDGKSDKLVALPRGEAKDHALHLTVTLGEVSDPTSAVMDVRARASGYADYALRANARRLGKRNSVPLFTGSMTFINGSFALQEQQFTSPSDLERDFQVDAGGVAIGICQLNELSGFIRSPLFIPSEWSLALHTRAQPVFLNGGYPLLLNETADVKLPQGAHVQLPPAAKNTSGPLHWSLAWSQPADESITVKLDCELTKGELSMTETTAFQQQLRELFTALSRPVIVSAANKKPQ